MNPIRILLVDDEVDVLRLLGRRLTRLGYEVIPSVDARQAIDLLEEHAFDLAILDVTMPGLNGLELAEWCRRRFAGLKILLLTGSPVIGEIEEAGYPHLAKPLGNLRELDVAVERILAEHGLERREGNAA
jgi:two-component system response regulator AtoC